MRDLIKTIIALVFILASYILGYYQADEKYSTQIIEANEKLLTCQTNIQNLIDSIKTKDKLIKLTALKLPINEDKEGNKNKSKPVK